MIVFPALDLRGGRVVRLRQGDPQAQIVYSDDPFAMARRWIEQGAEWLHVVNLDGALGDPIDSPNLAVLEAIVALGVPVQFGGGLRTVESISRVLRMGVKRIVLGTIAIRQPEVIREALKLWTYENIVAGIDARDGLVAIHGWKEASALTVFEVGRRMRDLGVIRAVYTDIRRDGMLSGVDVDGTVALAEKTGLAVIASGGVAGLEDIRRLAARAQGHVEGVIIGQALYADAIDLPQAIAVAKSSS